MDRVITTEKNFSKLKDFIRENKDKEIVFMSGDDELNRRVIEKTDVDVLLILLDSRRDFMKQRNSGLNEIMVKIMKKKNISLGVLVDEILLSKNKEKVLSRLKQNIDLCKRQGVKIIFIQKEVDVDERNLKSLLLALGAPTWMV